MKSFIFEKTSLFHMPGVYTVNAFESASGTKIAIGPETDKSPWILSYPSADSEEITNCLGGVMSMVPVTENGEVLISVMGLFPGFNGNRGGIFSHVRNACGWVTEKLFHLPFAHRCEILEDEGLHHVFMASVSRNKTAIDDWSYPGELYHGVYDLSDGCLHNVTCINSNIHKNHGMIKYGGLINGRECILVSGQEGIFAYSIKDQKVVEHKIFDGEVSEFAFVDIDNDGMTELVTIEPFHGDSLHIYRKEDTKWTEFYSKRLSFGHGLSAGTIGGIPLIVVGSRRGVASLEFLTSDEDSGEIIRIYEETGAGTTQSLISKFIDGDCIICANQQKEEVAMYKLKLK